MTTTGAHTAPRLPAFSPARFHADALQIVISAAQMCYTKEYKSMPAYSGNARVTSTCAPDQSSIGGA